MERVDQLDHVGVVAAPQDVDFRLHQFPELRNLVELFVGCGLDSQLLLRVHILRKVDISPISLPDKPHNLDVSYSLS